MFRLMLMMSWLGDDPNDAEGCIFTQNLLVPDVTADEINAAVASAGIAVSATATTTVTAAATTTASACTASNPTTSSTAAANTTTTSTINLGTCSGSSPFIIFGPGFDGRNQDSFEPADETTFNHGSALNIGVIADFICQRLVSPCNAPQSTIDACNAGKEAAMKEGVEGQAAADAFNAMLA